MKSSRTVAGYSTSTKTRAMPCTVSSKEIQRVRRLAKRVRAAVACARCKSFKVKCNDYRPCKQCSDNSSKCVGGMTEGSIMGQASIKGNFSIRREINGLARNDNDGSSGKSEMQNVAAENVRALETEPAEHAKINHYPSTYDTATDMARLSGASFLQRHSQMPSTNPRHQICVSNNTFQPLPALLYDPRQQSVPYYNANMQAAVNQPFFVAPSLPVAAQIAALLQRSTPPPPPPALQPDVLRILAAL